MQISKVEDGKYVVHSFCDICKCEVEIYGCLKASEEECQFCKVCYNILKIQLLQENARFSEIVPKIDPCSFGIHSWTHPNDQGHMHCMNCHAYQFDAEQARLHAHDPNVR